MTKEAIYFMDNTYHSEQPQNRTVQVGCISQHENCDQQYNLSSQERLRKLQERIYYEGARKQIALQTKQIELQQKQEYEKCKLEIRTEHQAYAKLISCTVFRRIEGDLMIAFSGPDGTFVRTRQLLNVENYSSRILKTYNPFEKTVLEISWGKKKEKIVYFMLNPAENLLKKFLLGVKNHGLVLLVSNRSEKEAAEALFAFSLSTAVECEIPYCAGWCKMRNGLWHFARMGEETMMGVMNNAL